jgi:hypothetical protein
LGSTLRFHPSVANIWHFIQSKANYQCPILSIILGFSLYQPLIS